MTEVVAFLVLGLLTILLMRELLNPQRDRYRGGILCGCIAIVASTHSLFREVPDSRAFQLRAAMIAAVVVAIALQVRRMRSA
jgi:hypothetical protein